MPFEILDETASGAVRLTVADGGQRIGVNGSPGSSAAVSVGGVDFIAGNSLFAANTVQSTSINPVSGTVTISGTATITTTAYAVAATDNSTNIITLSSGSIVVSGAASAAYSFW